MRYELYKYTSKNDDSELFILFDDETSDRENFKALVCNSMKKLVVATQEDFDRFENYFPDLLSGSNFISKHKTLEDFREFYIECQV